MSENIRLPWLVGSLAGIVVAACSAGEPPPTRQETRSEIASGEFDVREASIEELQAAMDQGRTTARALVDAYLARISTYDQTGPVLNAIASIAADARAQADRLDAERRTHGPRGPLHGIPVVVKDNYETANMPTTASAILFKGWNAGADATLVKKLEAAGAIVIAKTNMHEWALGWQTRGSLFGQTHNPYALDRLPGGSSGGTAVAVAANFASFGLGTDTCGSIREPAAMTNSVGLRPTAGLLSRGGIIPLSHTQDTGGPIARSVADVAIAMDILAGYDPADPTTLEGVGRVPPTYTAFLQRDGLRGARIGILTNSLVQDPGDLEVAEVIRKAADAMRAEGADVFDVVMPDLPEFGEYTAPTSKDVLLQEFKFDINRYLDEHPTAPVHSLAEIIASGKTDSSVQPALLKAQAVGPRDIPDYAQRLAFRNLVKAATLAELRAHRLDALLYPASRRKAEVLGVEQTGVNCQLSAHSGFPAISVPAGFTADGVPVGLELLGPAWSEGSLIRLAYSFEQATHHRRAPASAP